MNNQNSNSTSNSKNRNNKRLIKNIKKMTELIRDAKRIDGDKSYSLDNAFQELGITSISYRRWKKNPDGLISKRALYSLYDNYQEKFTPTLFDPEDLLEKDLTRDIQLINNMKKSNDELIYELLMEIDEGRVINVEQTERIASVKKLSWRDVEALPKSVNRLISLKELNLSGSNLEDISALKYLPELSILDVSLNEDINDISVLSYLKKLKYLDLSGTQISDISCLGDLKELVSLNLSATNVSEISILKGLKHLQYLDLSATLVKDISTLSELPSLHSFGIRGCLFNDTVHIAFALNIYKLIAPDIIEVIIKKSNYISNSWIARAVYKNTGKLAERCSTTDLIRHSLDNSSEPFNNEPLDLSPLYGNTSIKRLDLTYAKLKDFDVISSLTGLTDLRLSQMQISDIGSLADMKSLERLDLRYSTMPSIPESILDLNLDFISDEEVQLRKSGILINGLTLTDQPIEIFSQSRELIRAYYANHTLVPINECKVVFLGDGGAGKTHIIKRLLNEGGEPVGFDGNTTPGIEISVDQAQLRNSGITIDYWDFGGQEMLHSMHRMFLTERTLYVIVVDARDNTQDERARYWLQNIKSFANGAPVLLIVNKIDQNPNVSINEKRLREFYGQLLDIKKMSALYDSQVKFNTNLSDVIYEIIINMDTVQAKIPKAWKTMMQGIRSSNDNYLMLKQFAILCKESNIENYDKISDSLIRWLQILGISFRYQSRSISGQILLSPKWLVNAIYVILFNGGPISNNGIISQENLYDLLEKEEIGGKRISRVLTEVRYEDFEVNYILGVIRSFRLSYQLGNYEFFPMLCEKNEKISPEEVVSQKAHHFIFQYDYLPENVLHRLIVDFRRDLDYENVWFTGAVFKNMERSQKAYIRQEENELHIYVDGDDDIYNANEYLTPICDCIKSINYDMGLLAKEYITHKVNGIEVKFSYKALIGSLRKGNSIIYAEEADENVDIKEVLTRYDNPLIRENDRLINDICHALARLQGNQDYYSASEDSRNIYVRDLLNTAGYVCKDQTFDGLSATGKSAGRLDIRIEDRNGCLLTIYEALNLKGFTDTSKKYLDLHLQKLLDNYNSLGISHLVLVSYTNWSKKKFSENVLDYSDYILRESQVPFAPSNKIVHIKTDGFLRCMKLTYDCDGIPMNVYHFIVRVAR